MHILLAEDDELLGEGLRLGLICCQYNVYWVKSGKEAWASIQTEHFDIVILDLGLPGLSGEEVLKNMRLKKIETPVIILTSCDSKKDLIKGLDDGADDYVVKPFELEELCSRIRAVRRRATPSVEPIIIVGDIALEPSTRAVFKSGLPMELTRREFVLLQELMENVGCVLKKESLTQKLYGWSDNINSNALEVHIHGLRKKFGSKTISTLRGIGYMLEKS